MQDNHIELTAEVRQVLDVLRETKYNNKDQHPAIVAAIRRFQQALDAYGKTGLIVDKIDVSEELRETLYDREIRPLLEKIEQMAIRYSMPLQILLEWGDNGQCAAVQQVDRTPCPLMQHVMLVVSSAGDVDEYLAKVGALARIFGHNSKALTQLGIPTEPDPEIKKAAEDQGY